MESRPIRHALVLAGRRASGDPLAERAGLSHKALLPVAGVPMAARVLRALTAQPGIDNISVSSDEPSLVDALAEFVGPDLGRVRLEHHTSARSPAASVADYLAGLADGERVLVTTGDHALLTDEIVRVFLERADAFPSDLVVGVVSESVYRGRFPAGPRTFLRFSDVSFSGANLFVARAPTAARVAYFWVRLEGVRKKPWRLVSHFGVRNLLRFVTGRLSAVRALDRASRVVGARIDVVFLPFAEAALDVDRDADVTAVAAVLNADPSAVENPGGES
jgi:molybdopterin-guanine dinucleotide biosynthesis protein A